MTNCHRMETQNLVISFDYSWFLAKNFAYAECRIMKFHYRNSSITGAVRRQFPLYVLSYDCIVVRQKESKSSMLKCWDLSPNWSVANKTNSGIRHGCWSGCQISASFNLVELRIIKEITYWKLNRYLTIRQKRKRYIKKTLFVCNYLQRILTNNIKRIILKKLPN